MRAALDGGWSVCALCVAASVSIIDLMRFDLID